MELYLGIKLLHILSATLLFGTGLGTAFFRLACHRIELSLSITRHILALGEVLTQQSVGILVAAPLPGTVRIAEVDIHIGRETELFVRGQLRTPIPRQRLLQQTR